MKSTNRFIIWLFTKIWSHRLDREAREKVVCVRGWRTCTIDDKWGSRKTSSFMLGKNRTRWW